MRYWAAFNDAQRRIGGDPNIGIRLCNLMIQAGLQVDWLYSNRQVLARKAQ